MTEQTTGWRSRAIHNSHAARRARNAEIARLRAERIDDEHTVADLVAIQRDLKDQYYAREAQRRTAA